MARLQRYLNEFNLEKGMGYNNWTLTNIEINEVEIERFSEYEYNIILNFVFNDCTNLDDPTDLINYIRNYIDGNRIIKVTRKYLCFLCFINYKETPINLKLILKGDAMVIKS